MKKIVFGFMMAISMIASGMVFAQDNNPSILIAKEKKRVIALDSIKGQHKSGFNPFDGIQLTADQQQKLQSLRENERKNQKALKEE